MAERMMVSIGADTLGGLNAALAALVDRAELLISQESGVAGLLTTAELARRLQEIVAAELLRRS